MNLLFDIGHPAHVHLFRNFATEMAANGHTIFFSCREKDITIQLLEGYKLPYVSFGKAKKGMINKGLGMFKFTRQLYKLARKIKPDFLLSHGSIYAAQVSALTRTPHISFEDTGNMEQIALYKPFTKAILVSDSFKKDLGKKSVVYNGYHELAYLHPNRFSLDDTILTKYGLGNADKIILIRFVSWNATHDINHSGISYELKVKAVKKFENFGRVLITSEKELPDDLKPYQIKINPIDIFQIMARASLVFGESGTMASEAAVLGVPAVYIDSTSRDYTQEQEHKYGLVFNYGERPIEIEKAIKKGIEILSMPDKSTFVKNHQKLLRDKIDVTEFLINFIQNA